MSMIRPRFVNSFFFTNIENKKENNKEKQKKLFIPKHVLYVNYLHIEPHRKKKTILFLFLNKEKKNFFYQ